MKQIYKHICIATALFVFGSAASVKADDVTDTKAVMEAKLINLINFARQSPLAAAEKIGIDPNEVLKNFPALTDMLQNGLRPLTKHELLQRSAKAHTQDMLSNNRYSKISSDGSIPAERIQATGYGPEIIGESLGVVGFINFMDPNNAVEILFRNLLLDEYNPLRTIPRNILNEEFSDVGISIGTGVITLGRGDYNAYLVTCDFGKQRPGESEEDIIAMKLLHLINQARHQPLAVCEYLGKDADEILSDLPQLNVELLNGMPPMESNATLQKAARAHLADMLENDFYGPISSDGRTYIDRISSAGYPWGIIGETIEQVVFSNGSDRNDITAALFHNMYLDELKRDRADSRNILSIVPREVGIAVGKFDFELDGETLEVFVSVLSFGRKPLDDQVLLTGTVYRDINENGLYDPGEGLFEEKLIIESAEGDGLQVETDVTGGFRVNISAGDVEAILFNQPDSFQIQNVTLGRENELLNIEVP